MSDMLEVTEYDIITGNPDYKDVYHYIPKKIFGELVDFIHDFSASDENNDAIDFMRCYTKKPVGDVVSIKNYVGLIQLKSGFQIQILPKVSLSSDKEEGNATTKRIFLRMLKSMKDFPGKVFNDASLKVDKMNLYELFINMYLQEVRNLLRHGLKSTYLRQEANLHYYKGKLLTNENIKANIAHGERFFMAFDEYGLNRPENKIVKATLLKLSKITSSAENEKEIRRMMTFFEAIDASMNYQKDFSDIVLDRTTKDYEQLIKWSRVFLFNKSFTTFSGNTQSRALLFPMERVYESYVAQQIRKALVPTGWQVSTQDRGHYLFAEPQNKFALRPDIVLTRGNRIIIMDTKWKSLINNESVTYGISQQDMYQMYAYSKKYNTPEIWLLYPANNDMRGRNDIVFKSKDDTGETIVQVYFIELDDIENCLKKLQLRLNNIESEEGII